MTKIPFWSDLIANKLLQFLRLRKAAGHTARKYRRSVDGDFENAARTRHQHNLPEFILEGEE